MVGLGGANQPDLGLQGVDALVASAWVNSTMTSLRQCTNMNLLGDFLAGSGSAPQTSEGNGNEKTEK